MRKLVLLICSTLLLFGQLLAQTRTVTGRIMDVDGKPVPNATVMVKGSSSGTSTNAEGNFSIQVPANVNRLVVSAVGLATTEVALGSSITGLRISLKQEDRSLEEVVVTGYTARKKRDEAGAISSVKGEEIRNLPNPSLDKALQGRAAGVLVQANNGIPGGAINVRIRGQGSILAGNEPLYIVDGVQMNTRSDANFTQSNPLAFLNPNDIESIDILKDAASAAIYGAQASNGVVIVTTRKGRAGKTRFEANVYFGQATPLQRLEGVNSQQLFQLRSEGYGSAFNLAPGDLSIKRTVLNEYRVPGAGSFNDKQADSAINALPTYDWQDEAFRTGTLQNYELAASGGNDRTTFRISGSYTYQQAVVTKADFQRGGIKFDLTNKATDKLTIGTSINLSTYNQNAPFAVSGSFLGSPAFASATILPFNPIYNPDGTYAGVPPANLAGVLNQNIIAVNDYNSGLNRTNQIVGNINLAYQIAPWLSFRPYFGLDYRLLQGKRYTDPRTPDGFAIRGLGQAESEWNTNFMTSQIFNFNFNLGAKSKIDGLAGYEYRVENQEGIFAIADGFPTYQFRTLNTAANPRAPGEFFTGYKRQSVFGQVNYNFDSKYLISGTLRYDGSSRFGENNRYGLFPAVKFAWNIDNEDFLANARAISTLRFRASWGATGNDQIGNFDGLGLYGGGFVYNNQPGISFTQLANPELQWERNETFNLGVDFGFFRNRVNGSVELYDKQTKDLLLSQPVQLTSGFTSITRNVGQVQNKGVELTLGVDLFKPKASGDFGWTTTFVFTYNKNSVKSLYDNLQELPGDPSIRVGRELGSIFTQQYAGVNASTGRPMWYDTLGNLTYQVLARDRRYIGDGQPNYWGGLNNTLRYKGFTLDVFFQYEYGRTLTDGQANFMLENIARLNPLTEVYENRWTTPGQLTYLPRMNVNGAEQKGSGAGSGSRNFFKADYIRLKNVTLSYDINSEVTRRLKINNARFYIQGTNLWTYSDWYSYDIEFVGDATGIIPQSKNFTVGLQFQF
jgi:TonB-dependent starch-binding outer membrane protein SusC